MRGSLNLLGLAPNKTPPLNEPLITRNHANKRGHGNATNAFSALEHGGKVLS